MPIKPHTLLLSAACIGLFVFACQAPRHQEVVALGAPGSLAPHLASGPDGALVASWLERDGDKARLRYARMSSGDWEPATTLAAGSDWFVNWADFPSVVPLTESVWAAHWLQKSAAGTYAYDVMLSVSRDRGATWSDAQSPHADGTPTEHGFVSLYATDSGVGAIWLDGRETIDGQSPMSLRGAELRDNGKVSNKQLIDTRVCDCCQTDIAIADSGPVAAYRDRSDDEIRDVSVARLLDGRWGEGVRIADDGWKIRGCPVNGPAIVADGEHIVVAWFTAADNLPRVRIARSVDSGQQFAAPITLGDGVAIGRVGLVMLQDGRVLLSWLRKREDGQADVVVTSVSANDQVEKTTTVATTAAGSLSGVPQIALHGDMVVLAWTGKQDERRQVMTRRLPLGALR